MIYFAISYLGQSVPVFVSLEALRLSHNAIGDISAVASLVWICLDHEAHQSDPAECLPDSILPDLHKIFRLEKVVERFSDKRCFEKATDQISSLQTSYN